MMSGTGSGLLFFGLGCWILVLRIGGLLDLISPHSLSIGQITSAHPEMANLPDIGVARKI
jgi:hypothetical protein